MRPSALFELSKFYDLLANNKWERFILQLASVVNFMSSFFATHRPTNVSNFLSVTTQMHETESSFRFDEIKILYWNCKVETLYAQSFHRNWTTEWKFKQCDLGSSARPCGFRKCGWTVLFVCCCSENINNRRPGVSCGVSDRVVVIVSEWATYCRWRHVH